MTGKLLTGIIDDETYGFVDSSIRSNITRRAKRMQKEVKGYWGPVIHR